MGASFYLSVWTSSRRWGAPTPLGPEGADGGDALGAVLARFGDIGRREAADGVDRQRDRFTELGEAFPAQRARLRMGGGRQHAAEHGEIAVQRLGELQRFGAVTGRGDSQVFRKGPRREAAQLGGTQMHADAQLQRKVDVAIDQRFGAGLAAEDDSSGGQFPPARLLVDRPRAQLHAPDARGQRGG